MDARLGRTGTGARPRVRGWGEAAARGCGGERASPTQKMPRIRVESAAVRRVEPRIGIVGPARPCRPGAVGPQRISRLRRRVQVALTPPARRHPAFYLSSRACRKGPIWRHRRVEATRTARQRSQSALNGSSAPGPAGASQVHAFSAAAAPCSAACNPCRPGSSGPCCWDCVMIGTG